MDIHAHTDRQTEGEREREMERAGEARGDLKFNSFFFENKIQ